MVESVLAEPVGRMRLCWQSLGDASVLAELGRCEFIGRAWKGGAIQKKKMFLKGS